MSDDRKEDDRVRKIENMSYNQGPRLLDEKSKPVCLSSDDKQDYEDTRSAFRSNDRNALHSHLTKRAPIEPLLSLRNQGDY